MSQLRLLLIAAVAAAALVVPGAVDAGGAVTPLIATVGSRTSPDNFVISLTDSTGARVTHLDTGAYTITVHDYSTIHNFHLLGPGVDKATAPEKAGDETWNVVIINGTYRYLCDVHPTSMRGSFTAGLVTTPPPPKKLVAQVGPRRTISLKTGSGARVKQLTAGRYSIKLKDRVLLEELVHVRRILPEELPDLLEAGHELSCLVDGRLHLVAPGANRRTGVKARSTATWNVTLRAGSGTFRSDAYKRLRGSFRVVG